jgi:hypothetical protein
MAGKPISTPAIVSGPVMPIGSSRRPAQVPASRAKASINAKNG